MKRTRSDSSDGVTGLSDDSRLLRMMMDHLPHSIFSKTTSTALSASTRPVRTNSGLMIRKRPSVKPILIFLIRSMLRRLSMTISTFLKPVNQLSTKLKKRSFRMVSTRSNGLQPPKYRSVMMTERSSAPSVLPGMLQPQERAKKNTARFLRTSRMSSIAQTKMAFWLKSVLPSSAFPVTAVRS